MRTSDRTSFQVDEVRATDFFLRAFGYKNQGAKSILQVSVEIGKQSETKVLSGGNPNETDELQFYSPAGKALTVNCVLD